MQCSGCHIIYYSIRGAEPGGMGVGWRLLLFQGLTERLNGPNLCVDEHRFLFNNTEAPGLS